MQLPDPAAQVTEPPPPAPRPKVIDRPDFSGSPRPISEFAGLSDFPHCMLGVYVDIRGFAGVVVEILHQSIRVRPPEGITQRYNANRLKALYAPPVHPEPAPSTRHADRVRPETVTDSAPPESSVPSRVYIANPDYSADVRPISEFVGQLDFPACAYGKHVDIQGYVGVVVEILKGSLKIRSREGTTRSYNAKVLIKIFGQA
jgi:hypothetical protein